MMPPSKDATPTARLGEYQRQARELCHAYFLGIGVALRRVEQHLPWQRPRIPQAVVEPLKLAEARHVVAREAAHPGWAMLCWQVAQRLPTAIELEDALIDGAMMGVHEVVDAALERDPELARRSLRAAAALGNEDEALRLLAEDPSLAKQDGGTRRWAPLSCACGSRLESDAPALAAKRTRIVERLIELGADLEAPGRDPGLDQDRDWRPLELGAGRARSPELVRTLLRAGASAHKTALLVSDAVRSEMPELLALVLEAGPPWWQVVHGLTACAMIDRSDLVPVLMHHVTMPMVTERALLTAIRLGRGTELVEPLLAVEAKAELIQPVRDAALRSAIRHGRSDIAELLRRHGASDACVGVVDRVLGACTMGDAAEARRLAATSGYAAHLQLGDHSQLIWAIRSRRLAAVPLMLEIGLDPNVVDQHGTPALHLAVGAAAPETVSLLLAAGADRGALDFDGQTALECAELLPAGREREEVFEQLTGGNASPAADARGRERPDPDELDALFERAADAVAGGDLAGLRGLLDACPALVRMHSPRPHRATLLHYCAANGVENDRQRTPSNAAEIAGLLVARGADANALCNLYGGPQTTLGLLLTSSFPRDAGLDGELVRVLAQGGAKLEPGPHGHMMSAIDCGQRLGALALVEAGLPIENMLAAAAVDRVDLIEEMLAQGIDVSTPFWFGYTALHGAAVMGYPRAAALLLERGANPTARETRHNGTPAGMAKYFGHPEVASLVERYASRR